MKEYILARAVKGIKILILLSPFEDATCIEERAGCIQGYCFSSPSTREQEMPEVTREIHEREVGRRPVGKTDED